jgi:hypothetical protein
MAVDRSLYGRQQIALRPLSTTQHQDKTKETQSFY